MRLVLVAVGGAIGTLLRYSIGQQWGGKAFPWPTLGINLAGSLLIGVVLKLGIERSWSDTRLHPVSVGLLGGFTTFSTFSYEAQTLLRDGRTASAAFYVGVSVVGGLLAAALGYAIAATVA
jgi:CrcB protein